MGCWLLVFFSMVLVSSNLVVKHSSIHGWGLFANELIAQGSIVTQAPVIEIQIGDSYHESVKRYVYVFSSKAFVGLGYVGLINASKKPNSTCSFDSELKVITITALTDISIGDEITLNYL